jgi:hypothetical protein
MEKKTRDCPRRVTSITVLVPAMAPTFTRRLPHAIPVASMRLELHLQAVELRLRELDLELEGPELPLTEAVVIMKSVGRAHEDPVDEDVPLHVDRVHRAERLDRNVARPGHDHEDRKMRERDEKASGKVELETHEEAGPLSQEEPAEPHDQGRQRRPGVPVGERPGEGLGPRAAPAEDAGVDELDLGSEEKRESGPAGEGEPETRFPRGSHRLP